MSCYLPVEVVSIDCGLDAAVVLSDEAVFVDAVIEKVRSNSFIQLTQKVGNSAIFVYKVQIFFFGLSWLCSRAMRFQSRPR